MLIPLLSIGLPADFPIFRGEIQHARKHSKKDRTLPSAVPKVRPRTCSVDARKRPVRDVDTILPGTKQPHRAGKPKRAKQKYVLTWSVFSVFANYTV